MHKIHFYVPSCFNLAIIIEQISTERRRRKILRILI